MKIVIGSLVIVILFLLAYIFYIKKEISSVTRQLEDYNEFKSGKKLEVTLINKEIESLASSINKHINMANELRLKELKSKEELKNMISNISHDLRTPLTSIIGYMQMVKKSNEINEKELGYINKALKRAKDLQSMLESFFILSLVEDSNYKLELEKIDVKKIVFETLINFYEELEEKNIEPNIILKEVPYILGEEKSIKRIIENLMINAIKNTEGDIDILLDKDKDVVKLIIKNTIRNKVDIDRLFDRFYKGQDNSRRGNNTGLGLYIVKSLMENMNGKVYGKLEGNKLIIILEFGIIDIN